MVLWLIVGLFLFAQPAQEVIARFDSDTYTPLTGQPFTITLAVETPPGVILTDWPTFEREGRMWGKFEVQSVGEKTETPRDGGGLITQQSFVVILWRPEDAVTPETFITYSLGGDQVRRVPVREAFISVTSVVDPLAPELIPARPLIETRFPVVVVVGGALVMLISVMVLRRRKGQVVVVPLSAAERAAKALSGLNLDITRPAVDRLRDAVAILSQYGREVALNDALAGLIRAGEDLCYSGQPLTDGQVRGFIARGVALLKQEGRSDG